MKTKLKTIGLALVAIFAMSAIGASAASAAEEFRTTSPANGKDASIVTAEIVTGGPATVSAPHTFQATPGGLTVSCKMATFKGTQTGTTAGGTLNSPTVTVTPAYEDCSTFIGGATVTTTNCHYKLAAATTSTTAATANKKFGAVSLECAAGSFITVNIASGGCIIKFGSQTPQGGAEYINTGAGATADIDVEAHATNVSFTSSGGLCAFGGVPASGTEGVYKGNVTAKAFTDNNEGADENKTGVYNEGAQLGVSKS